MAQDIVLKGIISYPNVFEAKQINGKGDPKFSASIILDPQTDWAAVQACVQEALVTKFGVGSIPQNYKSPFSQADEDGFPGLWLIHGYSDRPVQVTDQRVQPVMDRSQVFAGCVVNVYVRFYGFDNAGNKGVGVGLNAVQIVDNVNVKLLDNTKDAKDVFKPIAGAPPALAPTAFSQPGAPVAPGAPQAFPTATPGPAAVAPTGPATSPSNPGPAMPWMQ